MEKLTKAQIKLILDIADDWEECCYQDNEDPKEVSPKRRLREVYGIYCDMHRKEN